MKCVVLDYVNAEIFIFSLDKTQEEEIDEILIDRYEYRLKDIEYMTFPDDGFNIRFG